MKRLSSRIGRWVCIGALSGAAWAAVGAAPDASRDYIRERLGVSAFTIQDFVPPGASGEGFEATFVLGGVPRTLVLTRTEINSPGATMVIDDGSGALVEQPAPETGIYQGAVAGVANSSVVAQMLDGRLSALVRIADRHWNIQPLADVVPGASTRRHVVVAGEDILGGGGVCGVPDGPAGHEERAHAPGGGPDSPLRCEMAIEADFQFYDQNGQIASATAQDIARVMAWAGKYFTEGANVTFKINKYVIRTNPLTNPYTTSAPGALLDQLANHWNSNFVLQGVQRDLVHLFTGREIDGDVIGIARISSVCVKTMGYGLSQSRFNLLLGKRASLTAHEIGHNFSAQHCDQIAGLCAPCRIMLAAIGIGEQNLSFGCSGPVITAYALERPCLEPIEGSGGPCRPDMNYDGQLTAADFGAFQTNFVLGHVSADFNGDGELTTADFAAFQTAFVAGCP